LREKTVPFMGIAKIVCNTWPVFIGASWRMRLGEELGAVNGRATGTTFLFE